MSRLTTALPVQPTSVGGTFVGPYVHQEALDRAIEANLDDAVIQTARVNRDLAEQMNLARLQKSVESLGQKTPVKRFKSVEQFQPIFLQQQEPKIAEWEVYDAKGSDDPSWQNPVLTNKSTERSKDEIVNVAADNIVASLKFYLAGLGLNSIDDKGLKILCAVHVGKMFDNAYYYDSKIHIGDGGGDIFKDFAKDLTVIAHELGHGIVDMILGGLVYMGQSGALNEHVADVMGVMAVHFLNRELDANNLSWLLGDECMLDLNGVKYSLRSFEKPGTAYVNHPVIGTDPQPADMDGYYKGSRDNYGVHINSGIPNKAFFEAINAYGTDIVSKLRLVKAWVMAVKKIGERGDFKAFVKGTMATAKEMYPNDAKMLEAIQLGWTKVKLYGPGKIDINQPAFEITNDEVVDIFKLDRSRISQLREDIDYGRKILNDRKIKNFKSAKVGFKFDRKGVPQLVVIAYVSDFDNSAKYPKSFVGYPIVVLKEDDLKFRVRPDMKTKVA